MREQRRLLLLYFGAALALFYSAYYYVVRGGRLSLSRYSVDRYFQQSPTPFVHRCHVYYDSAGSASPRQIAVAVAEKLSSGDVPSEARRIEDYKYFRHLSDEGTVTESLNDLLDLSSPFSVLLRHNPNPAFEGDFEVVVNGGKSLVFSLADTAVNSPHVADKIHDVVRGLFFKYGTMPSTHMTPVLDLNFLLTSDDRKVSWNVRDDIVTPYFHAIVNAMSLFYDVSLHSRVISGANLTGTMKLREERLVDLQEQEVEMFHALERVTSLEVATRDSSIYRHSIAFLCHLPHRALRFYDRALRRETDSVMIKGLGVVSFLDPKSDDGGAYRLTPGDIAALMGSWVTHIRKLHNLPSSLTETLADALQNEDVVTVVEDGHYSVVSPHLTFGVRMLPPGVVAFYGFEVTKIAASLYRLYLKGAMDNLQKVVKQLSRISFMTRVSEAAAHNAKECHAAISCVFSGRRDGKPLSNVEALALARTAFKQSLEAMGDDETYAKNVVSVEHGFAALLCDTFSSVFPMAVNTIKHVLNK
ncbi:uncharacterized protein BcabD6B2_16980 [Babesia caballi]|uniref:Membrane protein, putative n=1 Tax=Babesia caballi TaxID=5871 RepID=A0AAV4LQ31_BABCB|nr:membrane protein, putative [Babesia caballi]